MNGSLLDTLGTLSREFDAVLPGVRESARAELLPAQRELEMLSRKVLAAQVELDAAVTDAALGGEHGYSTTRTMLTEVHRLSPREATARHARCEQLATRRSLTGEVLPPRLPATAAALAEGAISAGHVEAIAQLMRTALDRLDPQTCAVVEEQVAGFARLYSPRETGVLGAQLLARLDPDGAEPADPDEAPRPDNTLFLGRSRRGRLKLSGEFDAAGEAAIRAVIDALAKPSPAVDGIPDERTVPARQGDALVDAMHQVLGFGDLPDCGGERPHVTLTLDLDDLLRGLRGALLDYGAQAAPADRADARLRRRRGAAGPRRPVTAPGPRPVPAHPQRRAAPRAGRARRWVLRDARLRPPRQLVRGPPQNPLGTRRAHHPEQPAAAVPTPPHAGTPTRLGNPPRLPRPPVFTPPALLDPTRTPRPSRMRC